MAVEALLEPLDRVRLLSLRALGPLGRVMVSRRELRVATLGSISILTALLLTLVAPLWMLALGPILLGVPHLLSDVRYLVVQPGYHRRKALWVGCGIPILAAGLGAGVAVGFTAAAGALVAAEGDSRRRAAGLALVGALILAAAWSGPAAALIFGHAHNFIAVALWWAWRPRAGHLHFIPLALFGLASAGMLLGVFDPLLMALGALTRGPLDPGMSMDAHVAWLAQGLEGPIALRLVLLFAFAQSVHYAVWLRLVPDEARGRETPRTFRATMRALEADFGRRALLVVVLLAVGLAGWAVFDLFAARNGYLRLALFHGHLELAAAALLFMEGRRR